MSVNCRKISFFTFWFLSGMFCLGLHFAAGNQNKQDLSQQLLALDASLQLTNPAQDLLVLQPTLVNHILPSLAPSEIINEKAALSIPSDLLKVAQLLLLRRMLYPQTSCYLVTPANSQSSLFLIVSGAENRSKMTTILDRSTVYRGTRELLQKMNQRFVPPESKDLISFKSLKRAYQNPDTIRAVQNAIKKQKMADIAEFGGFLTIEYGPAAGPLLHFYFVQTQGEDFIRTFKAESFDWRKTVTLMKDNPTEFAIVPFQYRSCLKTISLDIPEHQKEQRVKAFVDLFLYLAKNSYCPDVVRYVTLLSDDHVKGYFVGDFHIHPFDNDVSYQDKQNSREQRVLVVIPRPGGHDLVDLVNVHPHQAPQQVITYRSGTRP